MYFEDHIQELNLIVWKVKHSCIKQNMFLKAYYTILRLFYTQFVFVFCVFFIRFYSTSLLKP